VRAQASAADVHEANASAYSAAWQAEAARAGAYSDVVDKNISTINAIASAARDALAAESSALQALEAEYSGNVAAMQAAVQASDAAVATVSSYNDAQGAIAGAKNTIALANASMDVRNDVLEMNVDAANSGIQLARKAARSRILATGASALLGVEQQSYTVGCSTDYSTSFNNSTGNSVSHSAKRGYGYTRRASVSVNI
jgi:hypothetical protein